mgnify:CR=1 FL=1
MGNGRKDKKDTLIIHSITRLYLGGAQNICFSILDYLKNKGYNVKLITGKDENLSDKFINADIEIININELDRSINPFLDFLSFFRIRKLLLLEKRKYRNVIVHSHTSKAGIITRFAAYSCGIKDIYHTVHGWSFYKGQNKLLFYIYVIIERIVEKFTKILITVSNYSMNLGLICKIGSKRKYKTIYNGLNKPIILKNKSFIKDKLNIPKSKIIILQVSCLKNQKSPLDFVKIAEYMIYNKNLFFIIAGDGILKNKLIKYIQKRKINNVLLLGWYNNIYELYNIANIFILTSIFEGMPLTILEAISYDIPIIATDIGANKEILTNYKYLCKPHDIDCFVRNINKLINKSKKIKYDFNYTEKEMLREYERLYDL